MDGRPRTSEQPPARLFGEDTKVNDSFCVVTCRFSTRLLKGNKARIHPALRRTFIQVEPNACGKLKLSGRPARKILTSDWLRAESSSNRPFQKKKPELEAAPSSGGPSGRRPAATSCGDAVIISGRTNVMKWTSCCWMTASLLLFMFSKISQNSPLNQSISLVDNKNGNLAFVLTNI